MHNLSSVLFTCHHVSSPPVQCMGHNKGSLSLKNCLPVTPAKRKPVNSF